MSHRNSLSYVIQMNYENNGIFNVLQPPKAFLSTEYSQLLVRYSADIAKDGYLGNMSCILYCSHPGAFQLEPHMDENIFILLQSLMVSNVREVWPLSVKCAVIDCNRGERYGR